MLHAAQLLAAGVVPEAQLLVGGMVPEASMDAPGDDKEVYL